jgi:GT2 family glycosyltransferase
LGLKKLLSVFDRSQSSDLGAELSRDERMRQAVQRFAAAQVLFTAGKYRAARAEISRYERTVLYDDFERSDARAEKTPALSVVIVAFRTEKRLLDCIESVLTEDGGRYEIIVVDNGGNESVHAALAALPVLHIRCPHNLILSEGRNVGVHFSRGGVVAFLDDDAIVEAGYVASILAAFREYDIHALRGKVIPLSEAKFSEEASHYDLGTEPCASLINAEGNSAFRRSSYLECGGMDPLLFGHEGTDLGYALSRRYGVAAAAYWPSTVIRHDHADAGDKLGIKRARHANMKRYLRWKSRSIKHYRRKLKRAVGNRRIPLLPRSAT